MMTLTSLSGGELYAVARRSFVLGVEHADLSGDVGVRPQVVDVPGVHVPPVPLLPRLLLLLLLLTIGRRCPARSRRLAVYDAVLLHRLLALSSLPELYLRAPSVRTTVPESYIYVGPVPAYHAAVHIGLRGWG